jgi:hypothetical protein
MARFPRLKRKDSTPARQVTGTTYVAKGADDVKGPDFSEVGSAKATLLIDPVPALQKGFQETQTYLKMVRDDATVRMSLRAGKSPVLGAEWFIEPYSADPQDMAIAEFVEFNLFEGMTVPWVKILWQILRMYEAGRSVFEEVWETREWAPRKVTPGANRKQYTMLKKLAFRPPLTIQRIDSDDNGAPTTVIHNAVDAAGNSKEVDIPIEKCVVFVFDEQDGTLEGMSLLRTAYKPWWYKNRLYNIDSIQKERHAIGIPDIEISPGAGQKDIAAAHQLGQDLRTNEKAYIARPPTIKVGFAQVHGQLVDVLKSVEHHDTQILKNVMVQFLNMGVTQGGSGGRATGATGMDMFLKSMRHIAQSICDAINMYLIPELVAYNFPTDNFPKLSVRGVGEVKDLQMFSSALKNLLDSDAISLDEATEQWVRQQFDIPRLTTPWKEPSERPERVQELIQKSLTGGTTNGSSTSNTSKNGGGGNIGKSPSSGAV